MFKYWNGINDLMLMLCLSKATDLLATANHVHWHVHVLKSKDCHALRRTLDIVVGGQSKKGR